MYEFNDLGADPAVFGPSAVGYLSEEITYDPEWIEGTRTLRVALWYPAIAESGTGAARYPLFGPEVAEQEASPHLLGPAPLLVYSHGAKVWPEMGSFMAEFFASHGWVVASVVHTGDSLDNVAGDRPDEIYALRPLDLSALLDHLAALPQDHLLTGLIETERAVVSGHSFGGYTSFVSAGAQFDMEHLRSVRCEQRGGTLCESLEGPLGQVMNEGLREPRFVAAIPQSSGNYQMLRSGTGQVEIPTLMITATRDQANTEEGSNAPFWEALIAPDSEMRQSHRRLSFLEAGHATFTVACIFLPTVEPEDGCGPDFTPVRDSQALMLAYSLVFARAHLFGDSASLESINSMNPAETDLLPSMPAWAQWILPTP
jgi:predicted dienelactone hydrolase